MWPFVSRSEGSTKNKNQLTIDDPSADGRAGFRPVAGKLQFM